MARQHNRLLANEIINTTRSAGPKRDRNIRRQSPTSWWPIYCIAVILVVMYVVGPPA